MGDDEVDESVPVVPKRDKRGGPDEIFESLSRWLGFGLIVTGMYYDLELEKDVNDYVYLIGGVLAGVSSVLAKFKP